MDESQTFPVYLHVDDKLALMPWRLGWPFPRWGETFIWNDEPYCISHTEWHLENEGDRRPATGDQPTSVIYHIYLTDQEECDECQNS